MAKSNYKIIFISILDNFGKKNLSILISKTKVLKLNTKKINIVIIITDTY